MKVYHGSNQIVKEPKIVVQNRNLDFGHGFYTTLNFEQAIAFAKKVLKYRKDGKAYVNQYEISEDVFDKFDVRKFDGPNEEWFDFVCENRQGNYSGKKYDAIIGPVVNDDVYATFRFFENGVYSKKEALDHLKIKKLYNQILFSTENILKELKFLDAKEVQNG